MPRLRAARSTYHAPCTLFARGTPERTLTYGRCNPAHAAGAAADRRETAARRQRVPVGEHRQRPGALAPPRRELGAQPHPAAVQAVHLRLPLLRVRVQYGEGRLRALALPG